MEQTGLKRIGFEDEGGEKARDKFMFLPSVCEAITKIDNINIGIGRENKDFMIRLCQIIATHLENL